MRFVLLLLIAFCSASTLAQSREPPKTSRQPDEKTEQTTKAAQEAKEDHRGTQESPLVVSPLVVKTVAEKTKEEAAREEEDRRERASTDRWTVRIGIATFIILLIQAGVFAWQARRLRQTVEEMQRVRPATERAADAAEKAAIATAQATAVAKESAERQLRAYVHVVKKYVGDVLVNGRPRAFLTLRNGGQTPALNVRTWCKMYLVDSSVKDPEFEFEIRDEGSRSILPPSGITRIASQADFPVFTWDVWFQDGEPEKIFWVFGKVLYDDVFGNQRRTTFKLHSDGTGYDRDSTKMNLRWARHGNKTEQSKPDDEEDNEQEEG